MELISLVAVQMEPVGETSRCSEDPQLTPPCIGSAKCCGACSQKTQCTSGRYKYLVIHGDELARQRARELANTKEFGNAQRQGKKVEALFAKLKHQIGLCRFCLRRLKFVGAVLP